MKWKTLTVKNAFLIVSIVSVFLAAAPGAAVSADQPNAKRLAGIESVAPIGEGSTSELIIKLSAPATFTSYKTTSPLRLVVDLSQVTEGNIVAPVVVNQGNFKTVSAKRFDTEAGVLTRVEIELESDSEALINSSPANPGELRISFPDLAASAVSAVKNKPAEKTAVPAELSNTAPVPVSEQVPAPTPVPAPVVSNEAAIRTLTDVTVSNNTITLALDGELAEFKTFRLNKPERYVVDLMGVKSGLPSRLLPLNASGVASARIGLYPDKVRVVLDAVNGTFPEATSAKTAAGVVITLDVNQADAQVEKPVAVKTDVSAKTDAPTVLQSDKNTNKPVPPSGTSVVEMIDFQVVNGISRVSVKLKGDINAEQPVKIPGYVTLTIKNSVLPKNLQRSLETRAFITPVLRITPLSVKTKKSVDTKIRIAMRVDASFDFRREGDVIYIDFKHPEGLAGDKLIIEAIEQKNKPVRQKSATASDEEDMSAALSPVTEPVNQQPGTSRNYKGRKVTLEFADAEVRKIFQLLSEVSNKNFVLGDDVTGAISLKLVNVPWDQALDIILDTKGLDKREDGNIILIKGKGKFRSQAEEELEIRRTAAKSIELKTETFSVNYADLTAITSQFEKLKTPERGSIASDVRTSKVIVKDTPQALNDMRDLLYQLDLPEKQVMIEARIVEATSTFSRSLGVNWGVHSRDGSASFLGINALDSVFGGIASTPPTTGTGSDAGGSMGISFGKLASTIKLDMRLSAAASAGMIKIISSPKVATLNNKAAKISQGQSIPYTSSTSDKIETKFVSATLSLDVTPHINANGTIVMKIDAKNDFPGTGSPPPINTKQATTELLLKDGETTVIGGIFVDSDQESDEGVPFLMDIPFLGNLFKSNTKSKTKTELLIFITPRILGSV